MIYQQLNIAVWNVSRLHLPPHLSGMEKSAAFCKGFRDVSACWTIHVGVLTRSVEPCNQTTCTESVPAKEHMQSSLVCCVFHGKIRGDGQAVFWERLSNRWSSWAPYLEDIRSVPAISRKRPIWNPGEPLSFSVDNIKLDEPIVWLGISQLPMFPKISIRSCVVEVARYDNMLLVFSFLSLQWL